MKRNILFRADSSSKIGTGHIMRDLVLAKQYEEDNITFATQNFKGNISYKIKEAKYKIEILKSNKIKELDLLIKKLQINMLVIDSYDIDYKFEKKLKKLNPKLKILSLDDTYQKHHCDILLNHNISANVKKYKNLIPKECELRCGAKYTLIRDEFKKEKKKKLKKNNKKKTIFLAMGGTDHSNINITILKVLKNFTNIKVNVVTTSANQNLEALKDYIQGKNWIKLHTNSNKIAKLMNCSDMAIISPSVISHEVLYIGLPFISIMTGDDQVDMYQFFKDKKLISMKKFDRKKLKKNILKLDNNLKIYRLKVERIGK